MTYMVFRIYFSFWGKSIKINISKYLGSQNKGKISFAMLHFKHFLIFNKKDKKLNISHYKGHLLMLKKYFFPTILFKLITHSGWGYSHEN